MKLSVRPRLVHQINGLIRQKAFVDIFGAHVNHVFYHTILVRHSVVLLIARFKPQKNLCRLILPRLRYLHILKTAGQAPALLKIPFVFFVGGGSDKADFSRSQIRL